MTLFWNLCAGLSAAIPCFFMSARLFKVWRNPLAVDGGRWVRFGVGIIVMEFLVVHSGSFSAAGAGWSPEDVAYYSGSVAADGTPLDIRAGLGLKAVLFLALFYGLLAAIIAAKFRSLSLFTYFAFIMAGRLLAVAVPSFSEDTRYIVTRILMAIILYIGIVTLSLLPMPRGGMKPDVISRLPDGPGDTGLWNSPHQPIFAGAVYFFLLGCSEILVPLGLIHFGK